MASNDAARALKGKVALVTGAGRGLGRAFAERLASLGADIAIHGMREHGPAEYGEGSTLTAVAADVAAAHGVRTIRVLGDLTQGADIARVIEGASSDAALLSLLSSEPFDLVMVGTSARSVRQRAYLGRSVEALLNRAPCAVAIVCTN